ncbi:MAG: TlpA family protein disulfide reductase [Bacteroidia bacterium]|nr:TlpA family protein disulfide reductase [Bacteroidia bacterium]NNJ56362.1 TlpA family protein disulfide reductase [Bacteroidia bacterium]
MNFIKKQWSNILFGVLILLLVVPQTAIPIKAFVSRLFAFSPSIENVDERAKLDSYNWNLVDLNGKTVDFNDYKGKKIIVNFWATWCPPCVAEMPSMQALYNDYKDKVVFLFVTNENEPAITKFLDKNDYTLPIFKSVSVPPKVLQTKSLPTTYLINEEGEIVIDKTGAADWNSDKVRALLD